MARAPRGGGRAGAGWHWRRGAILRQQPGAGAPRTAGGRAGAGAPGGRLPSLALCAAGRMASADGGSSSVTVDEHGQKVRLVSPGLISVGLVLIPNAMMMRAHLNGGTKKIVDWVIHRSPSAPRSPIPHPSSAAEAEKARRVATSIGDYAFFLVPFVGLSLEKSFYDTAMCIQGVDPNAARPGAPRPLGAPHLPPTTHCAPGA